MTSIVCQGLQSCLEPRLIEPRILRPKLTPPKSNNTPQDNPQTEKDNEMCNNKNGQELGWSFIKALTNAPQKHKQITETEEVYVHPLAKSSSSSLSKKSLEMCTEGLGSETGSDISESSSDEYFSSVINIDKSSYDPTILRREMGIRRKLSSRGGGGNFPPPLTSISSSESVRVRPPRREGGRLVIEAVTGSGCSGYFQAERSGGRLRLCLLKDSPVISDYEESYDDEEEEEEEDNDVDVDVDDDGDDDCDDGDEASEEGSDDVKWDEEGAGGDNIRNVGGEIANIVELTSCSSRPISRCKESGHGNNNNNKEWGQFWVAPINS